MSTLAPPGETRAAGPVASRLAAAAVIVAGAAFTWGWLASRDPASSPPTEPSAAAPVSVPHAVAPIGPPPAPTSAAPQSIAGGANGPVIATTGPRVITPATAAGTPAVAPPPAAGSIETPVRAPILPSFDIVRVDPHGAAVLAGRSQPGAQVVVSDNGKPIARAQADAHGQWVALPAAALPTGGQKLTLATAPARPGEPALAGESPVVVIVPPATRFDAAPRDGPSVGAFALLLPQRGPAQLLQAPTPAAPTASGAAGPVTSHRLGLGTVDYDTSGEIRFAGTAAPHSTVRVYVDRHAAGDAVADDQGRWALAPSQQIGAGQHQLRLDQLGRGAAVAARVGVPFDRVQVPPQAVMDGKIVVQPGQSLWRIARQAYGRGIRYTVIYLANRSEIRNPNLIYPGQVFAIPASGGDQAKSRGAEPIASIRSR